MRRIAISSVLLLMAVLTLQAQTSPLEVLTWEIEGIGFEENKMVKLPARVGAIMFIHDGETRLLMLNEDIL